MTSCVTVRGPADAPEIDAVELIGVEGLSRSEILSGLANHPPSGIIDRTRARLDRAALEIDRRRIESFYRARGWFEAHVAKPTVQVVDGEAQVTFEVQEGEVSRFRDLELVGPPPGMEQALPASARLPVGEPAEYTVYEAAKGRVLRALQEAGYAHAELRGSLRVDREQHNAIVRLQITPGPLCTFGDTHLRAPDQPTEQAIRARQLFKQGDIYDPRRIEATRARLFQLPVLGRVQVNESRTPGERVDLQVEVSQTERNELRLGIGAAVSGSGYDFYGQAAVTNYGLLGPLWTTTLEVKPGFTLTSAGEGGPSATGKVTFTKEDFLLPLLQLGLSGAYARTQREVYASNGTLLRASLSRPFEALNLSAGLGLEVGFEDFANLHELVTPEIAATMGIDADELIVELAPSISWDGRDDALSPHSGLWAHLTVGPGLSTRGSYLSISPELRAYVPVVRRLVGALRARLDTVQGALPASRRLYGGGSSGHRGFVNRRLSPSIPGHTDLPIGGQASMLVSAELRLHLFDLFGSPFGIVGFVDAGDVGTALSELPWSDPHLATGGGLRYSTPVGSLRFDVGVRLNRLDAPEPDPGARLAFHFAIGESF